MISRFLGPGTKNWKGVDSHRSSLLENDTLQGQKLSGTGRKFPSLAQSLLCGFYVSFHRLWGAIWAFSHLLCYFEFSIPFHVSQGFRSPQMEGVLVL